MNKDARKVAWMSIVPLARLGQDMPCYHSRCQWQNKVLKGPICCTLNSQKFRKMEQDLHNVVPIVPLIRRWRGHRDFGKVENRKESSECGLWRDDAVVEPPDHVKGAVARAYLYMQDIHGVLLTASEQKHFTEWHRKFPPEAWEKTWDIQVARKQGRHNPYIFRGKEVRRHGE